MVEFTTGVPRNAMYVMSNTWWPTWLPAPPNPAPPPYLLVDKVHEIESITY